MKFILIVTVSLVYCSQNTGFSKKKNGYSEPVEYYISKIKGKQKWQELKRFIISKKSFYLNTTACDFLKNGKIVYPKKLKLNGKLIKSGKWEIDTSKGFFKITELYDHKLRNKVYRSFKVYYIISEYSYKSYSITFYKEAPFKDPANTDAYYKDADYFGLAANKSEKIKGKTN